MRTLLVAMAALFVLGACNKKEETENGIEYKIFRTSDTAQAVHPGDMLMMHVKAVIISSDSVMFDTYKNGRPFTLPADEATLKEGFAMLKNGDSAEFTVAADSFYLKSLQQPVTPGGKHDEKIRFTVSVLQVYSAEAIQKMQEEKVRAQQEQGREYLAKDSVESAKFLKDLKGVKSTASGLKYIQVKQGKGKMVKSGDKVTVKYKGMLLNGQVFDETKPGQPDFTFEVGAHKVIPGWDEGLQLMKEGDSYKLIIPWNLAYGADGGGPIPPFSTLVFDIEVLKVN